MRPRPGATLIAVTTVGIPGGPLHAAGAPAAPSETYVRWILTNVAGSSPSDEEVAEYAARLDRGGSRLALTTHAVRQDQALGFLVQLAYQLALGRDLDMVGARFWIPQIASGRRTLAGVHVAVASSAEAVRRNGGTAEAWVAAPYHLFLFRNPSAAEAAYWGARATTPRGRLAAARVIHASSEARRDFVGFFMQLLFNRDPDAAGLAYWSSQLPRLGELGLAARLLASDEMFRLVQLATEAPAAAARLRSAAAPGPS